MRTESNLPTRAHLKAGQVLRLYAKAGASFLVTQGTVSIAEAPVWSGDQFLNQSTILGEGEFYVLQRRGWITVDAHKFAEVLWQQRNANTIIPHPPRFGGLLRRLLSARLSWKKKTGRLPASHESVTDEVDN